MNEDIKKDLDGIKAALRFFIERIKDKEEEKMVSRSHSGIWKNHEAHQEYVSKERKVIDKKYKKLLDGLK